MTSLGLFILSNSHRHIQYVEVKESLIKVHLSSNLPIVLGNEIIVETRNL